MSTKLRQPHTQPQPQVQAPKSGQGQSQSQSQFAAPPDMSFSDIERVLRNAINGRSGGGGGWMVDNESRYYTLNIYSDYFVYAESSGVRQFSRTYSIDENQIVTLGEPTEVEQKTLYLPVIKMSQDAAFVLPEKLVDFSEDGETVVRRGKIFEVGDYPDKDFSLTLAEAQEAIRNFQPVPVDLEHMPTVLSGKLGQLKSIEMDSNGKDIWGEVALPAWLNSAIGEAKLKVSSTWNKLEKTMAGLALVRNPRVPDAVLMSAFAEFVGKRNNTGDQELIQTMHDSAIKLGAACDGSNATDKTTSSTKQDPSNNKRDGDENAKKETTKMSDTTTTTTGAGAGLAEMSAEELRSKLAELETQNATLKEQASRIEQIEATFAQQRADSRKREAATFAAAEVASSRALPREEKDLAAFYEQLAVDDDDFNCEIVEAHFSVPASADGSTSEKKVNTRLAAFRQLCASRLPHSLLQEQVALGMVGDYDPTTGQGQTNILTTPEQRFRDQGQGQVQGQGQAGFAAGTTSQMNDARLKRLKGYTKAGSKSTNAKTTGGVKPDNLTTNAQ